MTTPSTPLRKIERRVFFDAPPVVLGAFVLIEGLVPDLSENAAGWPLIISMFLIGMPHGAVDLSVSGYLACSKSAAENFRGFAKYAAILAVSLVVLLAFPSVALLLFVLISAIHFGLADARDLDRRTRVSAMAEITCAAALSRGGLILAMPFAVAPTESIDVFHSIITITGHSLPVVESATLARIATPSRWSAY